MPYAKTAMFWFNGLPAILLIGFWQSCFSVIFAEMRPTNRLHSAAMLGPVQKEKARSYFLRETLSQLPVGFFRLGQDTSRSH